MLGRFFRFLLKLGLATFLRRSYFFPNLSLDVLIDLVLNHKNACIASGGGARPRRQVRSSYHITLERGSGCIVKFDV